MKLLGIIGGSGLDKLENLLVKQEKQLDTPYGKPAGKLVYGSYANKEIIFLPRHGCEHTVPPHLINYRANIWALKNAGATALLAFSAVGGISGKMKPGCLIIPDEMIDYTYGRAHTFFEEKFNYSNHIDFTEPYSTDLRMGLVKAAAEREIHAINGGVYGATQGPRLETAAEIRRMERDGCDVVGMTGMPEAALARELNLPYACCAIIANWAAGKSGDTITIDDIMTTLEKGMLNARALLSAFLSTY